MSVRLRFVQDLKVSGTERPMSDVLPAPQPAGKPKKDTYKQ